MKDYTESLLVAFDPKIISYSQILRKLKSMSDPCPSKTQYRTAVFYLSLSQKEIAKEFRQSMESVDVEAATAFYMAEERHQNFLAML